RSHRASSSARCRPPRPAGGPIRSRKRPYLDPAPAADEPPHGRLGSRRRQTGPRAAMPPTSPAPQRAADAPLRLLLVEDDEGDAFLVSELLAEEDPSIVVRHVRSLAEAVQALALESPDCVLLDLGLPDATGLRALERLRAARPGVAHLVLT